MKNFKKRSQIALDCLPESQYKRLLSQLHQDMLNENESLLNLLTAFAKSNAWRSFGECRAFDSGRILPASELDLQYRQLIGNSYNETQDNETGQ